MIATDAAMLATSVVLFNHVGLRDAVERVTHYKMKVLSCVKCGTFWVVLAYMAIRNQPVVESIATAFALSYAAIWFELLLGYLSKLYEIAYDKIQASASHDDEASGADDMSEV